MRWIIPIDKIKDGDGESVGGKAFRLAQMVKKGINIPFGLCLSRDLYARFIRETRLFERINFELNRKPLEGMRWEEIWDGALRIRNLFIQTPIPNAISSMLQDALAPVFAHKAVAIRSSADSEDQEGCSFAGLHESYVNIRGMNEILAHIKLVWASLWSDRSLLYRKELGLDTEKSAMAVLIQALQSGESSGVAFSKSPTNENHCVIESVYGYNQGLVDGALSPDRWIVDRSSGLILEHHEPQCREMMVSAPQGLKKSPVPPDKANSPPLGKETVNSVYEMACEAEVLFEAPQDMEWTLDKGVLHVLQSRPITTLKEDEENDQRPWYLSLHRSFENLKALRTRIEDDILPAMEAEAQELSKTDLKGLDDEALALEMEKRENIYQKWRAVYWEDCIPFAHGMRLFGQVYNDKVKPLNPYEFMDLLSVSSLKGLERNKRLQNLAELIQRTDAEKPVPREVEKLLDDFLLDFNVVSRLDDAGIQKESDREDLLRLVREMAKHPDSEKQTKPMDCKALEQRFFSCFEGDEQEYAKELLDLGRDSHRLRDDDNLYLEMVEAEKLKALSEAGQRKGLIGEKLSYGDVIACLRDPDFKPERAPDKITDETPSGYVLKARQLVGQPAGPGWVRGIARVIESPNMLFQFKKNEILVCDAIDPGMTFVVPLAAGIVERRGGMLIHGAIIAREYGLPCVTGVPDATSMIRTGDRITVDGYLGLVIIG